MTAQVATGRSAIAVVPTIKTLEGGGFPVRRPFPTNQLDHVDPFLLLDHFGPISWEPNEAVGAPDHPHRGFETVTYLIEGRMQHKDSQGNSGKLGPGDVQWMTAGAGVVHSETPEEEFLRTGGLSHGFQIWVNLPARDKMIHPRYQDVPSAQIPVATSDDGKVRVKVVAGEALGARAVIDTYTPIIYLHFTIQPGGSHMQPMPVDHNAMVYVIDGAGEFAREARPAMEGQLVIFGRDGDEVTMPAPADATAPVNVLLLAGVPLNEPVARYGPFVMNTREEIVQAFEDYRAGRLGQIDF